MQITSEAAEAEQTAWAEGVQTVWLVTFDFELTFREQSTNTDQYQILHLRYVPLQSIISLSASRTLLRGPFSPASVSEVGALRPGTQAAISDSPLNGRWMEQ